VCETVSCVNVTQRNKRMYEIVNKGLNNLNGVYSGVTRHIMFRLDF
jgi:hypothetical protein